MTISARQHLQSIGNYHHYLDTQGKKITSKRAVTGSDEGRKIAVLYQHLSTVNNTADHAIPRAGYVHHTPKNAVQMTLMLLCTLGQLRPENTCMLAPPAPERCMGIQQSVTATPKLSAVPVANMPYLGLYNRWQNGQAVISAHLTDGLRRLDAVIDALNPFMLPLAAEAAVPKRSHQPNFLSQAAADTLFDALFGAHLQEQQDGERQIPFILLSPRAMSHKRPLRRLMTEAIAEQNTVRAKYLENHCNIRTKTVEGNVVGDMVLLSAEYVRNPLRAVVETAEKHVIPSHVASELEVTALEVGNLASDVATGYFTAGTFPIVKYVSAHALKVIGHAINLDGTCLMNDFSPRELASLLFNTEVGITSRGGSEPVAEMPKPIELEDIIPFEPQGVFVHEYMSSRLNVEKHLLIENMGKKYLVRHKQDGQLWAFELRTGNTNPEDVRVYFDESSKKIHFDAHMPAGGGVDFEVLEGNYFIDVYGKKLRFLYKEDTHLPHVVLEKSNGESAIVPVYMNPISKMWHLEIIGGFHTFNEAQRAIIKNNHVPYSKSFHYQESANLNPLVYGAGKIYAVSNRMDATQYALYHVIELKGQLLPVRVAHSDRLGAHYEVYSLAHQANKGYRVEWDGGQWIFEQPTSEFVSSELKNSVNDSMFARHVDASQLSPPDQRGLRWDAEDMAYLKVDNQYLQLQKINDYKYRLSEGGDIAYLNFAKNKFYPETFTQRLDNILNHGLSGRHGRKMQRGEVLPYDRNCVAMALSKVFRVNLANTIEKLKDNEVIQSASQLEHINKIIQVMERVNMPVVMTNRLYKEARPTMKSLSDGRYLAVNSKGHLFEDNKESHALAIIIKDGSIGIAGNNAENPGLSYNGVIADHDHITLWGPYIE